MNSAIAACVGVGVAQSVTYLAACSARRSDGGVTRNPRRNEGSIVFENDPV